MTTQRTLGLASFVLLLTLVACTAPTAPATAPSFGFILERTTFAAVPGTGVPTSATVTPADGFAGTVTLTLSDRDGSPADPGIALTPAAIVVTGADLETQSEQRQLTLSVDTAVALGSYDLLVTATSGDASATADLTLVVAATLQPQVAITIPTDGTTVRGNREVVLEGTLSAVADIANVTVSGARSLVATTFDDSSFSITVELGDNLQHLTVAAEDAQGRVGTSDPIALTYPFVDLEDFQPASIVLGQPDFLSLLVNRGSASAAANSVNATFAAPHVAADGTLYQADGGNNRVLGFHRIPTESDRSIDFALGQPDLDSSDLGTSATRMNFPNSVDSDGSQLAVADYFNHRVLLWDAPPDTTEAAADVAVGQPDLVSNTPSCSADGLDLPTDAALADGRLIVSDANHHRVLIWNEVPTSSGQPADVVLGQADFTSCAPNDDDQNGANDGVPSARTFNIPTDVWSDGERLVVADLGNNRVLIWLAIPDQSFTPPDLVLGQPDFVTNASGFDRRTFSAPRQTSSNGNQLFVTDQANNRVLIFDTFPTESYPEADRVLGQGSFTQRAWNDDDQDGINDGSPTARTLNAPRGVAAVGDRLLVMDGNNHRVLIYEAR